MNQNTDEQATTINALQDTQPPHDCIGSATDTDFPDRYTFRTHIATGAMGQVDLVEDTSVGRKTAIKTVLARCDEDLERRFIAEAKILGQLEHPNIVPLYDIGNDKSKRSFFTMRYIPGKTLQEIISQMRNGNQQTLQSFSWARRAQMLQQISDAIGYAHARGIVHCDLKPANVMIGEFGELVVMDWGIANQMDAEQAEKVTTKHLKDIDLSHESDRVIGTPAYLSPEVIVDNPQPQPARDIFAIGVIMYELLTLTRPFDRDTVKETLHSVQKHKPSPLYDVRNDGQRTVPVELHYICMKALHKEPSERYQSCRQLHDDLQLYLDGRYPIRCPSTALKRFSQKITHFIDDHPKKAVSSVALLALAATSFAISLAM